MICFDTCILIWGIQGAGTTNGNSNPMIARTRLYIQSLRESREKIMVPAPALAEYLQGLSPNQAKEQQAEMEALFFVPAFDVRAANIAADLARARWKSVKQGSAEQRQCLKTDFLVVATAIANRASVIITDNEADFNGIASGKVKVSNVPIVARQGPLFDNPH